MPSTLFGYRSPKVPHLVDAGKGGVGGEVGDLRRDTEAAFKAQQDNGGYIHTDEFTDLAAASTNALKLSFATSTSVQSFTSANLDGAKGANEMVPPRNVTVTSTANANVDAVAVTFVGRVRDLTGALIAQTDTINITDNGGVTDAGTKAFSFVDSFSVPAMSGSGGALTVGFGVLVGLSKPMRSMAGLLRPIREVAAGAVVTNGTFAATAPNGTYSPNTAPNGTNDYAISYIVSAVP